MHEKNNKIASNVRVMGVTGHINTFLHSSYSLYFGSFLVSSTNMKIIMMADATKIIEKKHAYDS